MKEKNQGRVPLRKGSEGEARSSAVKETNEGESWSSAVKEMKEKNQGRVPLRKGSEGEARSKKDCVSMKKRVFIYLHLF
jgi:hypothetical protein